MFFFRKGFRLKRKHGLLGLCLLFVLSMVLILPGFALGAMNFGQPYSEIGTFNGWTFWVGWDGSFSETYLPESETYAWVVYFAPEGIFVALQKAKSVYSAVDVFAGFDYFYGALVSPDGNTLKRSYIDSLLGVGISINNFDFTAPGGAPFSNLSAALKSGQSFFRVGAVHTLQRGIQYTAGMSVSFALVPIPIPISVSLDTESSVEAGFYPIVEWTINPSSPESPVDLIINALENLAAAGGTSFNEIAGRNLAQLLLPFMKTLPSSPYFQDFLKSQTRNTPIDDLIRETEQWLSTGDTSKLPEKIQPPVDPQEMHRLMLPVYGATQMAFELGYKHGCENNPNCTTIYADCVKNMTCAPGQVCRLEVTADEIAALVPGSSPADFEGVWIGFDKPFDKYLTEDVEWNDRERKWMQLEDGKAVYEFVLSTNNSMVLGVRVDPAPATGDIALELCRRRIDYTVPPIPPIVYAGADQSVMPGEQVSLKGYYLTDPKDTSVTYLWTQTEGPSVTLSDPTNAEVTFPAPKDPGSLGKTLTFQLTVTKSAGSTDSDSVQVTVQKRPSADWLMILLGD